MSNKFKESLEVGSRELKSSILGRAKYPKKSKKVKLPKGSSILGFAKYQGTESKEREE